MKSWLHVWQQNSLENGRCKGSNFEISVAFLLGIARKRGMGGGLNPRPNGLGNIFIEKNFTRSIGNFIDFGGGDTIAWMVRVIYAVKIEINMGICLCSERVLRLDKMLCALMYRRNGNLANWLIKAQKKCAPDCPFECV